MGQVPQSWGPPLPYADDGGGRTCGFLGGDEGLESLEVGLSLNPETVKPVPLAWFYDERFVDERLYLPFHKKTRPGLAKPGRVLSIQLGSSTGSDLRRERPA